MARTFDGANDNIHCAVGACGLTGAFTLVAVVRRNSNTNYHNLCTVHTSGGVSTFGLELESSGDGNGLQVQVGAGFVASTFTVLAADGWVLVAGGKVAGVAAPRLHKLVYSTGTWTHADGGNMFGGNPASAVGGTVRFGEWEGGDDLDGDLAAAAIFDRNLTDAEVEQLAHSLTAWHSLAPVGLWVFDQQATSQAVADLTGNGANQSSIAGTTVATSSVPGLSYGHELLVPHSVPAGGSTPISVGDAGAGADTVAVTATAPLTDGGSSTEAATASAAVATADAASAADTLTVAATTAVADTAAGADTLATTATVPAGDAGAAADTLAATATAPLADSASSAETVTAAVTVPLADTGSASEGLTVDTGGEAPKPVSDTGAAADTIAAVAAVPLADVAAAAEALTAAASLALAEAAAAADSLLVAPAVPLADAGAAGDALTTGGITAPLADTASSGEALTVVVTVALGDAGAAADAGTGQDASFIPKPLPDAGFASERLRVLIHRPATGTVTRPDTGVVARPDTGRIIRP